MKVLGKLFWFSVLVICLFACKKAFNPQITTTDHGYLVVEGVINSGNDTTHIKLSRTITLGTKTLKPESGANISVEGDNNSSYKLVENLAGTYSFINLNLSVAAKYRLHIVTNDGKEFLSDYVENKITPPIDSITYKPLTASAQFYVSAHDPANKSRYYRWDYDETWIYQAAYRSNLKYQDGGVKFRTTDELTFTCYRHARPSNSVFIGSSAKLASDVISNTPIGNIDARTGKFFHMYSMEVTQYALTPEAFTYWELLKKNTEDLGSIFDAAPSSSLTNIQAVNSKDVVIGYVSVSTTTKKRIFVEGRDLPFGVNFTGALPPIDPCEPDTILYEPLASYADREAKAFTRGDSIPFEVHARRPDGFRLGFIYAPKICVDCRLQGGTNVKPSFWP